jgi:Protein of unknown function (DUF3738)
MWWRLLARYLFGLSLMATALLLMSPPGRGQVTTADNRGVLTPNTGEAQESSKTDDQLLEDFLRIYRLDRDEKLKHVPPPRPEGIRAYWKRERAGFANSPDQFGAMTFRWRDPDRLVNWSMTSGDAGFRVQDLPRYLEMDIFPAEIDGDPDLLKTTVAGDWIYRAGTPAEQMVRALEIRLQRTLKKRITLKLRMVEREVVVVRGQYRPSPVTGRAKDQIEIYGKQIVPGGGGAGGGGGTYPEFLKWVGEWIERPVVSDVQPPPKNQFNWFYNARSPKSEQMSREDHDEPLVLQHLHEQTGLTFTRERRPIRILLIERAK